MDAELEKVIARLEARFDAALAKEEEEAAFDLKVSLQQDRPMADLLRAGSGLRILEGDGLLSPVSSLGSDYCGTGEPLSCVRRLGSAPLILDRESSPPLAKKDSLLEVARAWARAGRTVDLGLERGQLRGLLLQAGPDSLIVEAVAGRVVVPLWLVRSIRLVHGG